MACEHPVRIGSLCGNCGEEVLDEDDAFCALHHNDKIKLSRVEALARTKERVHALDRNKRMVLVLDLDQTVLHTTSNSPSIAGTFEFEMNGTTHVVKLRPFLDEMLRKLYRRFEIHIYTMGTREYAKKIAALIDPDGTYLGGRIISRDENEGLLVKILTRLFPDEHRNVTIVDDRLDVWDFSKNLLLVRPFWYFNRIDINDPNVLRMKQLAGRAAQSLVATLDANSDARGALVSSASVPTHEAVRVFPKADEDRELRIMTRLLLKVRKQYFKQKRRNVKKIIGRIRKSVFKGLRFHFAEDPANAGMSRVVKHYGGSVRRLGPRTDYIISPSALGFEDIAAKYTCKIAAPRWIMECAYSRKVVANKYVLLDCTAQLDDYERELDRMFFENV